MKKLILLTAIVSGVFISSKSSAQVSVGLNINIGSQPAWGPVGYNHVDYYYMPDIDVYYNVPQRQYVYMNGGRWIYSAALPMRYRNYDIYRGYKVVINEPHPYMRNNFYREKYSRYRGWNGRQDIIRDRRNYGGPGRGRDDDRGRGRDHDDRGHGRDHDDRGRGHDNGHGHRH